jgi:hypothetical protein
VDSFINGCMFTLFGIAIIITIIQCVLKPALAIAIGAILLLCILGGLLALLIHKHGLKN